MGIPLLELLLFLLHLKVAKRNNRQMAGIEELKTVLKTLLIICNDKLREIHGNLKLNTAFGYADNNVGYCC